MAAASGIDTIPSLKDGPHQVLIRAVDRAGNEVAVSVAFTVDTNPFSVTGPYGPLHLVGVGVAGGTAAAAAVWVLLRRRRQGPPPAGETGGNY